MTADNIVKSYKHYCFLSSGKFTERDFDSEVKAEDPDNSGSIRMGDMSSARRDLIMSDAKRHKEDMENKYPDLCKPEQKEEVVEKPKKKKKEKTDGD